jgi:adenylate cyclase
VRLPFRFRRFQSRLLVFFLGLLGLVLLTSFAATNTAYFENARRQIQDDLEVTDRVFNRLVESRTKQIANSASILSSDFAFKRVIVSNDHRTILSALESLVMRIGADRIIVVSAEYEIIADSANSENQGGPFIDDELIYQAEDQGYASSIILLDGTAHRMVVVPVLAPQPIAWLCVSFLLDQEFVNSLQELTLTQITILQTANANNRLSGIASTLPENLGTALAEKLQNEKWNPGESFVLDLSSAQFVTLVTELHGAEDFSVIAVLQRSMAEVMAPFYRLRFILLTISAGGLLFSLVGGGIIARTVTRPVVALVRAARQVAKGDYANRVQIRQEDEIGELGLAFNNMTEGLAERDKVRNILGKVVSPTVAHELMKTDVVLGGEERFVSVFFSDIEGFTSISESLAPTELVALLNEYLSAMTEIVDETNGVVDKFIGDAIMAFWGAPIQSENHALQAVKAAVKMRERLGSLQCKWRAEGRTEISIRMGINSGKAIIGNVGSKNRLDYTVMGDSVNLASRLEGANKYYGTDIMISESTYSLLDGTFLCRELDKVRVKGKQEPIRIYEVVAYWDQASSRQKEMVRVFHHGLEAFQMMDWERAASYFETCADLVSGPDKASLLYLDRINRLLKSPVSDEWDRVYSLAK